MEEEEHILAELSTLDDLLLPLSRSARLKYNCMSVSSRFIALGSNTGGIYLFSRESCSFLQVVFAEKETSPVMMAFLSPNDKYVAMVVSSGVLHVIDLKVESRAKPETLRSTSDWNGSLTYLHWDATCTRLYYGDSMGGVYEMTVHSSKAKNLFTLAPEAILKLDSSIVQIDKVGEKLLVSTMTRSYLCDTGRHQFSTIGKKLRDGQFGACFLCQGSTPTIYCARPGSRMWEVDIEGNVMNTHQFKQLLAIPPLPVVKINEALQLPTKGGTFNPQSLNFPNLKVVCGSYILTWTDTSVYILDPVNINVVLWSQPFTGIQDVNCLNNEIFIFLSSMQVHCLSLLPVSRVTALCLKSEAYIHAASLCIYFENSFCLKRKAKYFDLKHMESLYDTIVKMNTVDIAERLHDVIVNTERKLAALSDSESLGSDKSRTNSIIEIETSERLPNHRMEKDIILNHSVISVKRGTDEASELPVLVNEPESIGNTNGDGENTNAVGELKVSEQDNTSLDFEPDSNFKSVSCNEDKTAEKSDKTVETDSNVTKESVAACDRSNSEATIVKEYSSSYSFKGHTENITEEIKVINSDGDRIQCESTASSVEIKDNSLHIENIDFCSPVNQVSVNNFETNREILQHSHNLDLNNREEINRGYGQNNRNNILHEMDTCSADNKTVCVVENKARDKIPENGFLLSGNKQGHIYLSEMKSTLSDDNIYSDRKHDVEMIKNENHKNCDEKDERTEPLIVLDVSEVYATKGDAETVIDTNADKSQTETETTHSESIGKLGVDSHSSVRSKSPAPSFSSLKMKGVDDLEDDLELQSRSSNMGSRRPSLTSLSSLSSAEVFMEQVNSNFPEEIAVPVKRKSSKRRQRKSVEGTGELKKKGVKINRSFSLGAIQTRSKKDFSISPQGSLDHSIKEDCFTAVGTESDKIGQQTVSQSLPDTSSIREETQARSLPDVGELENGLQNLPVLDLNTSEDTDPSIRESVFSLSAEFSKSEEFARSDEFSESSLLRSYEGTREGISSSPKTAFKHLKDRVQKNLKSQTKKVITNIKDKHLLTRAKEFLSQPIDHQKSEFFLQAHEYEVNSGEGAKKDVPFLDETDSVPHSPVDISALQEITAETQEKLQDPSVLLNPDAVYRILLDWVTVLNKTLYSLHLVKFGQSDLSHSETVSSHVSNDPGEISMNKTKDKLCDTESVLKKDVGTEIRPEKPSELNLSENFGEEIEIELVDSGKDKSILTSNSLKLEEPGASILNDRDFCYTKDPLFLNASEFSGVSELAQACFDIGCHGDILHYKDLHASQNQGETELSKSSVKELKETVSELSDDLTDTQVTGTKDLHKGQGLPSECVHSEKDELSNLCDNLEKDICDKSHDLDVTRHEIVDVCADGIDKVKGEGQQTVDCNHGDELNDDEMAFYVRCYFPYLSAIKIRNKAKEHGKCCYQTWCALVSCLQELACDDCEKYGLANDGLLRHMIESLSPNEDGYVLLGHVSRFFKMKSDSQVSACVQCHPYVQPLDVLFMCSLHDVAIETTFKSYMQQLIQDATRTHRKDTISALYSHPDVKGAWLDILLVEEGITQEMVDSSGNPRAMSHAHIWMNQPAIEAIISQTEDRDVENMVLGLCSKYGYWNGCLRILKDLKDHKKQIDLILHVDDVRLLNAKNPIGYQPSDIEEWKELLQTFKAHRSTSPKEDTGSQSGVVGTPDWSDRITWNSLGNLLVRHLGPSQAVSLLQEMDVPESSLTASFYQTCAMAGLVHRHQRLVLHTMLEKIDTYLWAQRPVYSSPQLHHIVVKEKELQGKGSNSAKQEHLQRLIQQMKSEHDPQSHYVEDPDCHWGVETKINLVCPCCNIPLKEPVSHVEPGVLLFKCGHGYHRMCLPERDCFLCSDETNLSEQNTFI